MLGLAAIAWLAFHALVSAVTYADVVEALRHVGRADLAAAVALTALSFVALGAYDGMALRYVGHPLPYLTVGLASFCAYAVGNTAGFGPLTGGTIRYRFYTSAGLDPEEVAKVIAFVTVTFGLGIAFVSALALAVATPEIAAAVRLPESLLRAGGLAGLATLCSLLAVAASGWRINLRVIAFTPPGPMVLVAQFGVAALDIAISAAVLWVLLPGGSIGFPAFVGIYAVAAGLGVLSQVPAGLGVFEATIAAALAGLMPVENVIGALVLYRVVYHLLPLMIAAVILACLEVHGAVRGPRASRLAASAGRLSPAVLGGLTIALGVMLIFSSVIPAAGSRLALLANFVPLPLTEGAHFIASLLGLALLVAARGLVHRRDGAWWAAFVAALLAALLSLIKGVALFEAAMLLVLAAALFWTRRSFHRPTLLLGEALTPRWIAAIGTVLVMAVAVLLFVYRDVDYSGDLWWQFEFESEAPRSLRALLGLVIAFGMLAGSTLLRASAPPASSPTEDEIARAVAIGARQDRAEANLVRMSDKLLLFSADGQAFIMYGRHARSYVALFDPIGAPDLWPELIWRFVEMARATGGRPVFYQVRPEALALYADAGLSAYKIGETARVELLDFSLKGGKRAGLRTVVNRATREGLGFEVLAQPSVPEVIDTLRTISDAWLVEHRAREKRFSLGAFEPRYVQSQPVALVRDNAGRIVGFATLMETDTREEASIDLMRFAPDAPRDTMEFLFVSLMSYYRDRSVRWFDLGMAPLAGLSESPAAPKWHRLGRLVFENGEQFYNFRGLRAFKQKFHPIWQPRYMAVGGGINPAFALADTAALISGGIIGVVAK